MRESAKAASGGEAAVRRHKEEAFRRQSHFFSRTSSAKDVSISSSKNDKDITNNYHLYFGWVT
jgi:hypothetical protein